jgi:hypothetical protein
MYNISGDDEDGNIIHAYGEGSFPIRLSLRQAKIISEYLRDNGFHYWLDGEADINPKAVYRLWVNIRPEHYWSSTYEHRWGFKRITESSEENSAESHR